MKSCRTTDDDLAAFRAACASWLVYWGLYGWDWTCECKVLKAAHSEVSIDNEARQAHFRLDRRIRTPDGTNKTEHLNDCAFHEVGHVLLSRFEGGEEAEHELIAILRTKILLNGEVR